jgi:hypothetical protein
MRLVNAVADRLGDLMNIAEHALVHDVDLHRSLDLHSEDSNWCITDPGWVTSITGVDTVIDDGWLTGDARDGDREEVACKFPA